MAGVASDAPPVRCSAAFGVTTSPQVDAPQHDLGGVIPVDDYLQPRQLWLAAFPEQGGQRGGQTVSPPVGVGRVVDQNLVPPALPLHVEQAVGPLSAAPDLAGVADQVLQ